MRDRLVIAYNFPPFNDGSAVTLAKRVVQNDGSIDVISKDMTGWRTRDDSLLHLVSPFVDRHRMLLGTTAWASWQSIVEFVRRGAQTLGEWGTEYREVYSRSMFVHSHMLAAIARLKGSAKSWTAEFSDPLLHGADGKYRRSGKVSDDALSSTLWHALPTWAKEFVQEDNSLFAWVQAVAFGLADELVFTNSQQQKVMLDTVPERVRPLLLSRSRIEPHPTLPRQYYTPKIEREDNTFRIGYFGTFYPNRGAGELLEAWGTLSDEYRDNLSLSIFSDDPNNMLHRSSQSAGVGHLITQHRALPFLKFLKSTSSFDALLVTDITTRPFDVPSPFLPSKLSDYEGSPTPTMSLVQKGSPLDERTTGFKAEFGNFMSIQQMLSAAATIGS